MYGEIVTDKLDQVILVMEYKDSLYCVTPLGSVFVN